MLAAAPTSGKGSWGAQSSRGGLGENAELRVSVTWHSGVKAGTDETQGKRIKQNKTRAPRGKKKL